MRNTLSAMRMRATQAPSWTVRSWKAINRPRNRLKILFWDGSGLMLCTKRLERGTFAAPQGEGPSRTLRPEELQLLLHGVEGTPRARWYRTG